MRQRAAKANRKPPAKETGSRQTTSWEITSDERLGDYAVSGAEAANTSMSSIPIYSALHYQAPDASSIHHLAAAPSSIPLLWDMDGKNPIYRNLRKPLDPLGRNPPTHTLSGNFVGLQGSHLPSLAPAFIPDSRYQSYLLGRSKRKETTGITKIRMAKFCGYFSLVGVMFMVFVGILIDRQPMYLPGILPKHVQYTTGDRKPQVFYAVDISDRLEQASHAYRAAFLYLITACICLGYANNPEFFHRLFYTKKYYYQDIPDNDSTIPMFHNGPGSPDGLAIKDKDYAGHRFTLVSATMHRAGNYLASIWPELLSRRRNRRQRFAGSKDV
jgi:hypothetical protein